MAYKIVLDAGHGGTQLRKQRGLVRVIDELRKDGYLPFYAYVITSLYFTVPVDFLTGIEKRIVWFNSSYYAYKSKKVLPCGK